MQKQHSKHGHTVLVQMKT